MSDSLKRLLGGATSAQADRIARDAIDAWSLAHNQPDVSRDSLTVEKMREQVRMMEEAERQRRSGTVESRLHDYINRSEERFHRMEIRLGELQRERATMAEFIDFAAGHAPTTFQAFKDYKDVKERMLRSIEPRGNEAMAAGPLTPARRFV